MPIADRFGAPLDRSAVVPGARQPLADRNGNPLMAGVITGFRRIPAVGLAIDEIAQEFGIPRERLEGMADSLEGSPLGQTTAFAAEWVPQLLAGMGAYSLGRIALTKGAATVAGRLGAQRLGLGALTQRVLGGATAGAVPKPLIERGLEMAGGALGLGGLTTGSELAEGKSPADALRSGAFTAALSFGTEGAITALGKTFASGRELSVQKALARTRTPLYRQAVEEQGELYESSVLTARNRIVRQLLGSDMQDAELEKLYEQIDPRTALRMARRSLKAGANVAVKGNPPLEPGALESLALHTQGLIGAQAELSNWRSFVAKPVIGAMLLRDEPLNPKLFGQAQTELWRFLQKVAITPEGSLRSLGVTMTKVADDLMQANAGYKARLSSLRANLPTLRERAAEALGIPKREAFKDGTVFLDSFHKWERGEFTPANHIYDEIEHEILDGIGNLAKGGNREMLVDRTKLGVEHIWPHLIDRNLPIPELRAGLEKALVSLGKSEADAAHMAEKFLRGDQGIRQLASMTLRKRVPGTLKDKIDAGFPVIKDPFYAVEEFLSGVYRQTEYQRFGSSPAQVERFKRRIVDLAVAEGASRPLATSALEAALPTRSYSDLAMERFAQGAVNLQVGSKMVFGVIPNATQWLNDVVSAGLKNNVRGLLLRFRGATNEELMKTLALQETILQSQREAWMNPLRRTLGGEFADWMLRRTGFSWVERQMRIHSGLTGIAMYKDTLLKTAAGKLRGRTYEAARRRMGELGFDLDRLAARMAKIDGSPGEKVASVLTREGELQAAWRQASRTQFVPSDLNRPPTWWTPVGRLATQFKGYALGQTRLLRDSVLAEAAKGNPRPLGYFLSFFPVAGELVGDIRSIATGRKPSERGDGIERILSNMLAVGGLGMATDVFMSARWGRLPEVFAGPTAADMFDIGESLARGDAEDLWKQVTRQPIWKAMQDLVMTPLILAEGGEYVLDRTGLAENLDAYFGADERNPITLDEMRRNAPRF